MTTESTVPYKGFAWDRYWCPRGGTLHLDLSGFLTDPGGDFSKYLQPDVVRMRDLESGSCVICLGEPGMGKSHELRRHFEGAATDGHSVLFRDLRQYDSTQAISDDIFGSDAFRHWLDGSDQLTLVLDSLDEALLEIRPLGAWLLSQLERYPGDRLRIRIACRTAQWPQFLESGLQGIWENDGVAVYEIAPLTRADVQKAARAVGLDPDTFMAEVFRREAGPLANKPTTLGFLFAAFTSHEAFPSAQTELYRLGCLHLCAEDEERKLSRRAGALDPRERLAVAARVAAATVFGNRSAVWRGDISQVTPSAEVSLLEISGGVEPVEGGGSVTVTEASLEEALGTGLFSARGARSLGWAHQTYGEFLAAHWVVVNGLKLPQIESLIRHPEDPGHFFVPQLRETIAWLATMNREVRALVLSIDPGLLLEADLRSAAEDERVAAVDAFLQAAGRGELPYPDWYRPRRYERLEHAAIAEQLLPYLHRPWPDSVRELALEIGAATAATPLQADAVEIALDPSEALQTRVEAARFVAAAGDPETKLRLLPLAVEPQEDDIDDELKGTALQALWPELLESKLLFEALSPPKRPNHSGAYDWFLSKLEEELNPDVLPGALRWAATVQERFGTRRRLVAGIIRRAWGYLDRPEVLSPFADLAALRFVQFEDLTDDDEGGDVSLTVDRRRLLVQELVGRMGTRVDDIALPFSHRARALVGLEDAEWLLQQTAACELDDPHGQAWARLLQAAIQGNVLNFFEQLYQHRERPHINRMFSGWWEPVLLDSRKAEELRRQHQELEELEEKRQSYGERKPRELPSEKRVVRILDDHGVTTGHTHDEALGTGWCLAAQELVRTEDGLVNQAMNLDSGPTWDLLASSEREQVLEVADRYVRSHATSVPTWTQGGGRTFGTWAGDRALRLIEGQAPNTVRSLPDVVWAAWCPVIVGNWPPGSDSRAIELHQGLLARAYAVVPEQLISAVLDLLRAEDEKYGGLWNLNIYRPLWDDRFSAAMQRLAEDPVLSVNGFRALLDELLEQGVSGARAYAESLIAPRLPRKGQQRGRAVAAAAALLRQASDGGWSTLRPILRRAPKFRREVALASAERGVPLERFSEDQLADIFTWLTEDFPYPDPEYEGVYSPSAEDQVRSWRGRTLTALRERASPTAVAALKRLKERFPELTWLSRTILKTREAVRQKTWTPPDITQLKTLAERADRRLVESGDHLLDVLTESLDRFEGELHGELPAVSTLWDNLGDGRFRPKDEQELSDAVARHLRRDLGDRGVIAGREVVIRRGGGGGVPGQRTDLYVTAMPANPAGGRDPISVIVEVKGAWHDELLSAMETQLVGSYLARNPECRHGLYLVGWCLCDRWIDEPRKRKTRQLGSVSALKDRLREQAGKLSLGGASVRAVVVDAGWR